MPFELSAALRSALIQGGEAEVLAFGGRWRSWRWIAGVSAAIDSILAAGGRAGAAGGLIARTKPQHVAVLAAQLAAHRPVAMIYSAQSAAGMAADIERLALPVIFADENDWTPEARAAAERAGSIGITLRDAADPAAVALPVTDLARAPAGAHRTLAPDTALELLSSGTTGAPKRIPLSWSTVESAVLDAKNAYAGSDARSAPVLMAHPLGNVSGLGYVVPPLAFGQRIVLIEKFDAVAWAAAVRDYRPLRAALSPAGVRMVLDAGIPREDLASLTVLGVGGGKLDLDLHQRFEETYGIPVLTAFGATEFGGVITNWTLDGYRTHGAAKRGSAGRPSANVRLRIVDPESHAILEPGAIGLLEAQVQRIGPHWIRTNDLASIDTDGFLFLHGRADCAINRGGFKIAPDAVAAVLKQHPAVADAGVVGKPEDRLGEMPVAAVELRPGASPTDGAALRAWAKDRLLAYEVPVEILVVPALPRNASMKISAPDLLALFTSREN